MSEAQGTAPAAPKRRRKGPRELAAGCRIGPYRLVRHLGRGGMGSVFEARHDGDGTRLAIKVLHPELAYHRKMVRRFFNEARALAKIGHPHIVKVGDFGTTADGHCVLLMELLEGRSLLDEMRALGKMEWRRACRVGGQVARALAASHAVGIVHRDIKPENLFLTAAPDGGDFVKVLDFGVAKLLHKEPGEQTESGVVLGTVRYMSPEQCRGDRAVDHRADIYSLAMVLFRVIAGRMPFDADTPGDLVVKHLTEAPRPLDAFVPDAPAGLVAAIARALAKDPADRFQRMDDFGDALAPFGGPARAPGAAPLPVGEDTVIEGGEDSDEGDDLPEWPTVVFDGEPEEGEETSDGGSVAAARRRRRRGESPTTISSRADPSSPGSYTAITPERWRGPWRWIAIPVATVAAAAAAVALVLALRARPPAPPPKEAPPAAPVAVPAVPAAPAAPKNVKLRIVTRPPGARVYLDDAKRPAGVTPFDLERRPDSLPVELRFELAGYETLTESVVPDSDQTVNASLARKTNRRRPHSGTGGGDILAPNY